MTDLVKHLKAAEVWLWLFPTLMLSASSQAPLVLEAELPGKIIKYRHSKLNNCESVMMFEPCLDEEDLPARWSVWNHPVFFYAVCSELPESLVRLLCPLVGSCITDSQLITTGYIIQHYILFMIFIYIKTLPLWKDGGKMRDWYWLRRSWWNCRTARCAERGVGKALDVLCDSDWRALKRFDHPTGQRLIWTQTAQLEVIVHRDVRSQHLQI